jgi:hypothetical protein
MAELLPGFRYGDKPMADFSARTQQQFHFDNLRWMLESQSPIGEHAAALYASGESVGGVATFNAAEQLANAKWLAEQSQSPEVLLHALQTQDGAPPQRLGRYAESLLSFYLQRAPLHRLIAEHVPIRRSVAPDLGEAQDHTTLGELDYLLQDSNARFLHWELAIKFFLAEPDKPTLQASDFIGPDRKNSLHLKLEKMFQRQLRQSIPERFLAADLTQYSAQLWHRQAYSRGYLFYRLGGPAQQCAALNTAHARGFWLPMTELESLPDAHYLPLPRWRWLANARCTAFDTPLRRSNLMAALTSHWQAEPAPRAVLIAQLDPKTGLESARYFIRNPG